MSEFKDKMLQRFMKYVAFDTESCDDANVVPTTEGQFVFARYLEQELKAMGLSEVVLDDKGYLYATFPCPSASICSVMRSGNSRQEKEIPGYCLWKSAKHSGSKIRIRS